VSALLFKFKYAYYHALTGAVLLNLPFELWGFGLKKFT
jgi:hypothetical protein